MKLFELISGPGFYGEIVIMEPDETADDEHTFKEAYSRMDYRPLHAAEIPPRLLNYTVREISAMEGYKLSHAIFFYCTPN